MGKKGGWFSSVRKALSPLSKEKNGQKAKSKKNNQTKNDNTDAVTSHEPVTRSIPPPSLPPSLLHDEAKQNEDNNVNDNNTEQNNHAYSVASATAAAAEVVRLTTIPRFFGKSKDEIAAIKIQTAFRGYLARRALRALRGLVRLKSLIEGQSVKRQAATTLRCMQTLARVQSHIHVRRIRMSEENQALQRQLQQKHESELDKLKMGEEWDDSVLSKEQIEADLQNKQVAAMRRERALAYAFTHQQSRKHKHSNPTFLYPNNPHWGWGWLERWMAARPWESRSVTDNDHSSVKSFRSLSVAGEINRAYALQDFSLCKPSPTAQKSSHPPSRRSPSTPSRTKTKPPSPSPSPKVNGWGPEDETKSVKSVQSEQFRRHSIGGSMVRDDESLASSPAVPSYMTSTRSAKAKNKPPTPSPVGVVEKTNTPNQKLAAGSVKKRLSFPASPGGIRRHSVPGKMEHSC